MQEVGDGWWEGRTPEGETGLFPETYVEIIASSAPPSAPPAAPPMPAIQVEATPAQGYYDQQQEYGQEAANDDYRDRAESWDDTGEWDDSGPAEVAASPANSTLLWWAFSQGLSAHHACAAVLESGTMHTDCSSLCTVYGCRI